MSMIDCTSAASVDTLLSICSISGSYSDVGIGVDVAVGGSVPVEEAVGLAVTVAVAVGEDVGVLVDVLVAVAEAV